MEIATWFIVGAFTGVLVSAVLGSRLGLLADLVLGIAGGVGGGFLFRELGWRAPLEGIGGMIVVALAGAMVLLVALRLILSMDPREHA